MKTEIKIICFINFLNLTKSKKYKKKPIPSALLKLFKPLGKIIPFNTLSLLPALIKYCLNLYKPISSTGKGFKNKFKIFVLYMLAFHIKKGSKVIKKQEIETIIALNKVLYLQLFNNMDIPNKTKLRKKENLANAETNKSKKHSTYFL